MDITTKLKDDVQHFRNEAARHARSMRKLKGHMLAEYYQGRYEALKHAADYLAITVDYVDWRADQ